MTGTPTDASPECGHPANELLDFHVNGSLEGDEAAMVAAHVASCAACTRDVRELRSLSEGIATHGVGPAVSWRGRSVAGWIGAAAALVAVVAIADYLRGPDAPRTRIASSPAAPGGAPAAPGGAPVTAPEGAPAGVEAPLDLGVGTMRGAAASPPTLNLEPGVSLVRLTLTPTVVPGADLVMSVRGPAGEDIVADQPLPPSEAGRVVIRVPASRLTVSGTYQVVLKTAVPGDGAGPFFYPFVVTLPTSPRTRVEDFIRPTTPGGNVNPS